MSNKTRKRFLPVALVMAVAAISVVALALALTATPRELQAHGSSAGDCSTEIGRQIHDALSPNDPCPTPTPEPTVPPIDPTPMAGDVKITSSSTSGSATVELQLTINLSKDVPVGGAFVLYLEDDYQEPDSISASDVYFVVPETSTNGRGDLSGNGARVYATQNPEIDTDDHFTADKKDIDIRVSVPDLCSIDTTECQGQDGLMAGDTVTMVIQKSAGIKNPSEAGKHSVGASVISSTDSVPGPMYKGDMVETKAGNGELLTVAKISLSDVDNSRGYEMTVTGSGFNNGTTAGAYVLAHARYVTAKWWETLDCAGMKAALGKADSATNEACFHFDVNDADKSYKLSDPLRAHADFMALDADDRQMYVDMVFSQHLCRIIIDGDEDAGINGGTKVGGAVVGSDDKVAVTFEVTAPTFQPGNVNFICMVDGEGRASTTDVEDFKLEPSIKVVPNSVSSGDTVNVFAQDFPNVGAGFTELEIADQDIPNVSGSTIRRDGSGEATFEVPGGFEGVLRIDAKWGDVNENSKITITGGELSPSKSEVLPNETITITGNGFGSQTCIPASNITLDNVPVIVDDESLSSSGGCDGMSGVEVSNSGQFVATIVIWPNQSGSNPTLIPGVHELSVEDTSGFGSDTNLTIPEPIVTVTPDVAGPRDYITIVGENWPVDNPDNPESVDIKVEVADAARARTYTLFADAVGRVTQEHRVHRKRGHPQRRADQDDPRQRGRDRFLLRASLDHRGDTG